MTIVASVKVHDGIVLGSDSATQIMGSDLQGNIGLIKVYQNAKKLFQYLKSPIGILTYGIGNIGEKSIETLLLEFEEYSLKELGEHPTIEIFSERLFVFFKEKHEEPFKKIPIEKKPVLGFLIAGYSPGSSIGEEWEFVLPISDKPKMVRPINQFGSSWRGQSVTFTRLYYGFDPRAKQKLKDLGVSDDIIEEAFKKFETQIVYNGMPVQDAIEFVEFILKTTIGLVSFEIGSPSCSEPIDIAVIDSRKKFTWITEKNFHL